MPSKTPKQKSFMAAVANNPKFAKKVGVSSKVGKEFEMKDKKMGMKKMADKAGRAMTKKSADTMGRAMPKMAKGGSVSSRAAHGHLRHLGVGLALLGNAISARRD